MIIYKDTYTSRIEANPDTIYIDGENSIILRDDEGTAKDVYYDLYYRNNNARPFILCFIEEYKDGKNSRYNKVFLGDYGDGHGDVFEQIDQFEADHRCYITSELKGRFWEVEDCGTITTFWYERNHKDLMKVCFELLERDFQVNLYDGKIAFDGDDRNSIVYEDVTEYLGLPSNKQKSYSQKVTDAFKQKHGGFEPFEYHQLMYQEDKKSNKPNINESVTDIVYHFTDGYRGIINQNCFYFRANDTFDGRHPEGFDFCLSVTRCKNDKEGYSLKYSTQMETDGHITSYARFTLDGRLLNMNPNLKGQPFNFFYSRNLNGTDSPSPKQHYHNFLADPEASQHDNYPTYGYGIYDYDFDPDTGEMKSMDSEPDKTPEAAAFRVQNEDRIFSRIQRLDNANKYVKRIDIFVGTENQANIIQQLRRTPNIQLYKDRIFIYRDNNEFNKQSNNCFALSRLTENKMKFDMNDINYMVNEVINRLLKK